MLLSRGLTAAALTAGLVALAGVTNAADTSKEVTVVNPPSAPVPVTATAPLPVNGTVAATQLGPWLVGIDGTPTVQVAPPQRFKAEIVKDEGSSTFGRWTNDTGRRFIIEVVTEQFSDKGLVHLILNEANVYSEYWFPAFKGTDWYPNIYFATVNTKISVEAGATLFSDSMTDVYGHYNHIYLVGYLEP